MKYKSQGFTLIEIMITVAIVAILGSVAFSAYKDQIEKTRRADGKALLTNISQQLERCYTKFGRYDNAGCSIVNGTSLNAENNSYNVAVAGVTATTYTLTATPLGTQVNDTTCGNLGLDQAGQQTYTGTGTIDQCW